MTWQRPSNEERGDSRFLEDRISYWRPFSLEFFDRLKEDEFKTFLLSAWVVQDKFSHISGLFIPFLLLKPIKDEAPLWFILFWLFIAIIYAPANLLMIAYFRDTYTKNRTWMHLMVRLGYNLFLIPFGKYLPVPRASLMHIFAAIVAFSPTICLVITSLVLRLKFKHHLIVALIALCECFLWIPDFCTRCEAHSDLNTKFDKLGRGMDYLPKLFYPQAIESDHQYPCWMVSAMVMIIFAFVMPTFLIFTSEVSTRSVFLRERLEVEKHSSLFAYTNEAINVATIASFAVCFASWFLLAYLRYLMSVWH